MGHKETPGGCLRGGKAAERAPYLRSLQRAPTGTAGWSTGRLWQGRSLWADWGGWCGSLQDCRSRSPAGPGRGARGKGTPVTAAPVFSVDTLPPCLMLARQSSTVKSWLRAEQGRQSPTLAKRIVYIPLFTSIFQSGPTDLLVLLLNTMQGTLCSQYQV